MTETRQMKRSNISLKIWTRNKKVTLARVTRRQPTTQPKRRLMKKPLQRKRLMRRLPPRKRLMKRLPQKRKLMKRLLLRRRPMKTLQPRKLKQMLRQPRKRLLQLKRPLMRKKLPRKMPSLRQLLIKRMRNRKKTLEKLRSQMVTQVKSKTLRILRKSLVKRKRRRKRSLVLEDSCKLPTLMALTAPLATTSTLGQISKVVALAVVMAALSQVPVNFISNRSEVLAVTMFKSTIPTPTTATLVTLAETLVATRAALTPHSFLPSSSRSKCLSPRRLMTFLTT